MTGIIYGNPVIGKIGLVPADPAPWFRSQRFGCTGNEYEPPLGSCKHFHRANDISKGDAGRGAPVLAMQDGIVLFAGTLNGGSRAVVVGHIDNEATGVSHLMSWNVATGQRVKKGQQVGRMGDTGVSTGYHTHTARKTNFPTNLRGPAAANAFYLDKGTTRDGRGDWVDIWPRLEQNIDEVHPDGSGVYIRTKPDLTVATRFAITKPDGRIHRISDNQDLGPTGLYRDFLGTAEGAVYKGSNDWVKMALDGTKYVHRLLAVTR